MRRHLDPGPGGVDRPDRGGFAFILFDRGVCKGKGLFASSALGICGLSQPVVRGCATTVSDPSRPMEMERDRLLVAAIGRERSRGREGVEWIVVMTGDDTLASVRTRHSTTTYRLI